MDCRRRTFPDLSTRHRWQDLANRLQRAGFRVPLVRTAMGRACVAGMRPEQRERLFDHLQGY